MTEIKFPKKSDDGSFVVIARFSTPDTAIVSTVRDFLKIWMSVNNPWNRIWRSSTIWVERLDFYSEFLAEPRVQAESGAATSFSVVFEGKPSATRWKDWTVFIVNDISTVFPEIKFERFD